MSKHVQQKKHTLLHMHMFWDILLIKSVFKFHIVYINMCSIVHLQNLVLSVSNSLHQVAISCLKMNVC
jgi:hypothetical protein